MHFTRTFREPYKLLQRNQRTGHFHLSEIILLGGLPNDWLGRSDMNVNRQTECRFLLR